VSGHRNPLAGFDSPDVAAQVVLEPSDAGLHVRNIATCGHIRKLAGRRRVAAPASTAARPISRSLRLVSPLECGSGAAAVRCEPRR
jgi:hypothetical protein